MRLHYILLLGELAASHFKPRLEFVVMNSEYHFINGAEEAENHSAKLKYAR